MIFRVAHWDILDVSMQGKIFFYLLMISVIRFTFQYARGRYSRAY
jgi:hypothetical protein